MSDLCKVFRFNSRPQFLNLCDGKKTAEVGERFKLK